MRVKTMPRYVDIFEEFLASWCRAEPARCAICMQVKKRIFLHTYDANITKIQVCRCFSAVISAREIKHTNRYNHSFLLCGAQMVD